MDVTNEQVNDEYAALKRGHSGERCRVEESSECNDGLNDELLCCSCRLAGLLMMNTSWKSVSIGSPLLAVKACRHSTLSASSLLLAETSLWVRSGTKRPTSAPSSQPIKAV